MRIVNNVIHTHTWIYNKSLLKLPLKYVYECQHGIGMGVIKCLVFCRMLFENKTQIILHCVFTYVTWHVYARPKRNELFCQNPYAIIQNICKFFLLSVSMAIDAYNYYLLIIFRWFFCAQISLVTLVDIFYDNRDKICI